MPRSMPLPPLPDYSLYSCADPYCGLDPYMDVHYSDEAAELYTTANPLRETTEAYPKTRASSWTTYRPRKITSRQGRRMSRSVSRSRTGQGAAEYIDMLSLHLQRALAGRPMPKRRSMTRRGMDGDRRATREEPSRRSSTQASSPPRKSLDTGS